MLPLRVLRVRVAFSAPTTRVTGVCTPAVTPAAPVIFPDGEWKHRRNGAGRRGKRKQRRCFKAFAHCEMFTSVDNNVEYFTPRAVVPLTGRNWTEDIHDGASGTGGDVGSTKPSDTGEAAGDVALPRAASEESDGRFCRESAKVVSKRLYSAKNGPHPLDASAGVTVGVVELARVAIAVRPGRQTRRTSGMLLIVTVRLREAVEKGPGESVWSRGSRYERARRGSGNGSVAAPAREAESGVARAKICIGNIRWRKASPRPSS